MKKNLIYQIALTLIPNVGPKLARVLVSYCGSPEAVFRENGRSLSRIPGIGRKIVHAIRKRDYFIKAEKECEFVQKHGIQTFFYLDATYPHRLQVFDFSPVLFYYKGNGNLSASRMLGVVGTRKPSMYGKQHCRAIVGGMGHYKTTIVSGLAFGIDICAHRACLDSGIPTLAVLGSGLDRIYPREHKSIASRMIEQGGLLTEFPSGTGPERENFPMRNRIISALTDALLVVESKEEGGSMITANFSFDYSRDVFAVPGRVGDELSAGPNKLIRDQKAALVHSADQLASAMMWDLDESDQSDRQISFFPELNDVEQKIVELIRKKKVVGVDELITILQLSPGKLAGTLLHLEFKGVIQSLPGKTYKINI